MKEQIMSSDLSAASKYFYQQVMEGLTFVGQVLCPIILFTVNKMFFWEKLRQGIVAFCSSKE